jgi:predicted TIM-barrel fold metal-dependent hydrolase
MIIGNIGVQGFYCFGSYADMALLVAARHDNVYLETSSAPLEVVEKAVIDPLQINDRDKEMILGENVAGVLGVD